MDRTVKLTIAVEVDEDDGGYVSEIVEHPGIASQGDTEEEAVRNAVDAYLCVVGVTYTDLEVIGRGERIRRHRVEIPVLA